MSEVPTFVTHLECSGKHYPAGQIHNLSDAGKPLLVRYDLEKLGSRVSKDGLSQRPPELWRYREFLPVRKAENIVSLGEVMTPLLTSEYLQKALGMNSVVIKDEGRLPTGSFKARGLALAVSMAKEFGIKRMAMPTNGNAGAALAAYCSQAGIESFVFCPDDTPDINIREIAFQGAHTWTVDGLINDCGRIVADGRDAMGWFDTSTLKAFAELEAIGWLTGSKPRMVAVQSEGCAPIVEAFDQDCRYASPWENAHTVAAGIRVPVAIGDFLILDAIRESNGFAAAVSDVDILETQECLAREEGLLLCPEGAATAAALIQEVNSGRINRDDHVVLFNCATGLKYSMPAVSNHLKAAEAFSPTAF